MVPWSLRADGRRGEGRDDEESDWMGCEEYEGCIFN